MVTYPTPVSFGLQGCVAALGNFDGVHTGHRALLAQARDVAATMALPLVVLTFEPHPRSVLFPHVPLLRLTDAAEKERRLRAEHVDTVAVLPFDTDVAAWSPEHFVEHILVGWLQAKAVVVGSNFRYGAKAAGDTTRLQAESHFITHVVPLLKDDQGIISSRRLRAGVTS